MVMVPLERSLYLMAVEVVVEEAVVVALTLQDPLLERNVKIVET